MRNDTEDVGIGVSAFCNVEIFEDVEREPLVVLRGNAKERDCSPARSMRILAIVENV